MVTSSESCRKEHTDDRMEAAGEPVVVRKDTVAPVTGDAERFRIITNVFRREENADYRVGQLHENGMSASAKIHRSGQWYVYCSAHGTLEEAREALDSLVRTTRDYNDSWILDTHKQEKR